MTEGFLNEVIRHYGARIRHAETGSTLHGSALTHEQERAMIPTFAAVVLDMIDRDLIEIRELSGTWEDSAPMGRVDAETALVDHHAWLVAIDDPETNRMIVLGTTDLADRLLDPGPSQRQMT